jgi:mono/diheme cytochrome c family protein
MSVTALVLLAAVAGSVAQEGPSVWDGTYSEVQATRGKERYNVACATCHAEDLQGGSGPALAGQSFMDRWTGSSVNDMVQGIQQTMPQDSPNSLGTPAYVDIAAFLLQGNGVPAGKTDLPVDAERLKAIRITSRPAGR